MLAFCRFNILSNLGTSLSTATLQLFSVILDGIGYGTAELVTIIGNGRYGYYLSYKIVANIRISL